MVLHARPPIVAGGQGWIAVPSLTGLSLVSLPVFDPRLLCEEIVKRSARHLSLAPSMATELVNWPQAIRYDLSSVVTELRVRARAQGHHSRARGALPVRASAQPILVDGGASEPSAGHHAILQIPAHPTDLHGGNL